MKLRIGDQEYDYHRAMQKIGLAHLLELQEKAGVGRRTIMEGLDALDEALTRREGETDEDYLDRGLNADHDPKILRALPGLIFVCKRHAGETVSVEDAGAIGWDGFQFVPEESDLVEAPDPTTASGDQSQPDAETPNVTASRSSGKKPSTPPRKSKTSKVTSTPASS